MRSAKIHFVIYKMKHICALPKAPEPTDYRVKAEYPNFLCVLGKTTFQLSFSRSI